MFSSEKPKIIKLLRVELKASSMINLNTEAKGATGVTLSVLGTPCGQALDDLAVCVGNRGLAGALANVDRFVDLCERPRRHHQVAGQARLMAVNAAGIGRR